jgi:hypothetical protein
MDDWQYQRALQALFETVKTKADDEKVTINKK